MSNYPSEQRSPKPKIISAPGLVVLAGLSKTEFKNRCCAARKYL